MTKHTDFIRKNGRKLYAYFCCICGEKFYRRKDAVPNASSCYCSRKCVGVGQTTATLVPCDHCGKETMRRPSQFNRSDFHYCSHSCASASNNKKHRSGKNHPNYTDGRSSYRRRALDFYEHKCHNPNCALTPTLEDLPVEMLDVDHIDNDRSNNKLENLMVLCVWCHALKTRGVEEC